MTWIADGESGLSVRTKLNTIPNNGTVAAFGTASALNVGTAANNIVQLSSLAKLPAVDGSQLTNLPTSTVGGIFNVKDYGAVGNGIADDTAAIQAAVTALTSAGGGTILFPLGTYLISSPITFELSAGIFAIAFVGAPGAKILGDVAGDALLKRSANSPVAGVYLIQNLILENTSATGKGILFHSIVGGKIVGCQLSMHGGTGIETYNSQSVTVDSCSIISASGTGIGVMAGNATTLIACDITAMGEGIRHYNAGLTVLGGRLEVNTIGINLGVTETGAVNQSVGVFISGVSMESNGTGLSTGGGLSSASIEDISISCAQTGKVAGINITNTPDHLSIRNVTVSNSAVGGWSAHGINIAGGNYITLENVSSGTALGAGDIALATGTHSNFKCSGVSSVPASGTAWTIGSGADIIFDRCPDAPIQTLAQLPAASAVAKNSRRAISDATSALGSQTYGAAAVGTGAAFAPVWADGTTWRYG